MIPTAKVMTVCFLQALEFAASKHSNQRRKDPAQTPYINHPIAVANILLSEVGIADENVLIAALLHDTVEDTDTTLEEIERRFGTAVRDVVDEVTDDKTLAKAVRKQQQIEHAGGLSNRAKLVKLADKTANLRDIVKATPEGWSTARVDEYLEWGKTVVEQMKGTHAPLETLFDEAYAAGKAKVSSLP